MDVYIIEGQKALFPLSTLTTAYPNHRLHTTDLAATQGVSASTIQRQRYDPAYTEERPCLLNKNSVEPVLCDERVSNHDTHRCDTLKESAVLPTFGTGSGSCASSRAGDSPYYPGSSVE